MSAETTEPPCSPSMREDGAGFGAGDGDRQAVLPDLQRPQNPQLHRLKRSHASHRPYGDSMHGQDRVKMPQRGRERDYLSLMARLDVPDGPGGEAAMIWTLRPELGGMVERMIRGAYQDSILPADERELARMRIAEINDCVACSDFRAPSVLDAGIAPELYANVSAYATYPGYSPRQRLAIEYAERFATDHASIDDDVLRAPARGCSPTRRSSISRCVSPSFSGWDGH